MISAKTGDISSVGADISYLLSMGCNLLFHSLFALLVFESLGIGPKTKKGGISRRQSLAYKSIKMVEQSSMLPSAMSTSWLSTSRSFHYFSYPEVKVISRIK